MESKPPGCYILVIVGEPHAEDHKKIIVQRVAKGLRSWDIKSSDCDLQGLEVVCQNLSSNDSDILLQYSTETLAIEVLYNPLVSTAKQCLNNLLSSFTGQKILIHAGYAFTGSGSWILQNGVFTFEDFSDAFQEAEVQKILRSYPTSSIHVHCTQQGKWMNEFIKKQSFNEYASVLLNPKDVSDTIPGSEYLIESLEKTIACPNLKETLQSSSIVGNIRFNRPTLYVFPGGQGDCALFGINGFNLLIDGGFSKKPCFWDFIRHLDRLDAVMMTRLSETNACGITTMMKRKAVNHVYPQLGYVFCNISSYKKSLEEISKDDNDLLVNVLEEGYSLAESLTKMNLTPHPCLREVKIDPFVLYQKVGHGTLDMYVLNPPKDSKELKEFFHQWSKYKNDFSFIKCGTKPNNAELSKPLSHLLSITALLVWKPAHPKEPITRILFTGSTPQNKIFEGLEKLKYLDVLKHHTCTSMSMKQKPVEKFKPKPETNLAKSTLNRQNTHSPSGTSPSPKSTGASTPKKEGAKVPAKVTSDVAKAASKKLSQNIAPKKVEVKKPNVTVKKEVKETKPVILPKTQEKPEPKKFNIPSQSKPKATAPKKSPDVKGSHSNDQAAKSSLSETIIAKNKVNKTKSSLTPTASKSNVRPSKPVEMKTKEPEPTVLKKSESKNAVKRPSPASSSGAGIKEKVSEIAAIVPLVNGSKEESATLESKDIVLTNDVAVVKDKIQDIVESSDKKESSETELAPSDPQIIIQDIKCDATTELASETQDKDEIKCDDSVQILSNIQELNIQPETSQEQLAPKEESSDLPISTDVTLTLSTSANNEVAESKETEVKSEAPAEAQIESNATDVDTSHIREDNTKSKISEDPVLKLTKTDESLHEPNIKKDEAKVEEAEPCMSDIKSEATKEDEHSSEYVIPATEQFSIENKDKCDPPIHITEDCGLASNIPESFEHEQKLLSESSEMEDECTDKESRENVIRAHEEIYDNEIDESVLRPRTPEKSYLNESYLEIIKEGEVKSFSNVYQHVDSNEILHEDISQQASSYVDYGQDQMEHSEEIKEQLYHSEEKDEDTKEYEEYDNRLPHFSPKKDDSSYLSSDESPVHKVNPEAGRNKFELPRYDDENDADIEELDEKFDGKRENQFKDDNEFKEQISDEDLSESQSSTEQKLYKQNMELSYDNPAFTDDYVKPYPADLDKDLYEPETLGENYTEKEFEPHPEVPESYSPSAALHSYPTPENRLSEETVIDSNKESGSAGVFYPERTEQYQDTYREEREKDYYEREKEFDNYSDEDDEDELVRHDTPPGEQNFYQHIGPTGKEFNGHINELEGHLMEQYLSNPQSRPIIDVTEQPLFEASEESEEEEIKEQPIYGSTQIADFPEFITLSGGTTPSDIQSPRSPTDAKGKLHSEEVPRREGLLANESITMLPPLAEDITGSDSSSSSPIHKPCIDAGKKELANLVYNNKTYNIETPSTSEEGLDESNEIIYEDDRNFESHAFVMEEHPESYTSLSDITIETRDNFVYEPEVGMAHTSKYGEQSGSYISKFEHGCQLSKEVDSYEFEKLKKDKFGELEDNSIPQIYRTENKYMVDNESEKYDDYAFSQQASNLPLQTFEKNNYLETESRENEPSYLKCSSPEIQDQSSNLSTNNDEADIIKKDNYVEDENDDRNLTLSSESSYHATAGSSRLDSEFRNKHDFDFESNESQLGNLENKEITHSQSSIHTTGTDSHLGSDFGSKLELDSADNGTYEEKGNLDMLQTRHTDKDEYEEQDTKCNNTYETKQDLPFNSKEEFLDNISNSQFYKSTEKEKALQISHPDLFETSTKFTDKQSASDLEFEKETDEKDMMLKQIPEGIEDELQDPNRFKRDFELDLTNKASFNLSQKTYTEIFENEQDRLLSKSESKESLESNEKHPSEETWKCESSVSIKKPLSKMENGNKTYNDTSPNEATPETPEDINQGITSVYYDDFRCRGYQSTEVGEELGLEGTHNLSSNSDFIRGSQQGFELPESSSQLDNNQCATSKPLEKDNSKTDSLEVESDSSKSDYSDDEDDIDPSHQRNNIPSPHLYKNKAYLQDDSEENPIEDYPLGEDVVSATSKWVKEPLFSPQESTASDENDQIHRELSDTHSGGQFKLEEWDKPMGLPSPPGTGTPLNGSTPGSPIKRPLHSKHDSSTRSASRPRVSPVYVDLAYVPHHGDPNYSDIEFFERIRARYYVFSGTNPSKEVLNALLEAKKNWRDESEVTIIPTYETDTLGYWMASNQDLLTALKIEIAPSASRCTVNLQDHETSCAAYRLEF